MTPQQILSHVDHTLLRPDATPAEIETLCHEALRCKTASVCVNPRFVPLAYSLLQGEISVCTVVGFPLGACTTAAKVFETQDAVQNGASEIDMVIPVGILRAGLHSQVAAELAAVRAACPGSILKVIVETCLLQEQEKKTICGLVSDAGADYIKTSTGFSTGGATAEDITLFAQEIARRHDSLKIKASGGIKTLAAMQRLLSLGADRLGCSAAVALLEPMLHP